MATAAKKFDQDKAPVVSGFLRYFPRAVMAVANVSKGGKEKYDVEYTEQNWRGLDKARLEDAEVRHLLGEELDGLYDPESKALHAAHRAWEAMAYLELLICEIEEDAKKLDAEFEMPGHRHFNIKDFK